MSPPTQKQSPNKKHYISIFMFLFKISKMMMSPQHVLQPCLTDRNTKSHKELPVLFPWSCNIHSNRIRQIYLIVFSAEAISVTAHAWALRLKYSRVDAQRALWQWPSYITSCWQMVMLPVIRSWAVCLSWLTFRDRLKLLWSFSEVAGIFITLKACENVAQEVECSRVWKFYFSIRLSFQCEYFAL